MRLVPFVLAAAALTGCGFVTKDPGGWGSVKWGMSQQQVCAAYPDARPLKRPLVLDDKTLVAPIWLHNHEIDGSHWDVWFFFPGGKDAPQKLAKVQLESSDAIPLDVVRPMKDRYGSPDFQFVDNTREDPPTETARRYSWMFSSTIVLLQIKWEANYAHTLLAYTSQTP